MAGPVPRFKRLRLSEFNKSQILLDRKTNEFLVLELMRYYPESTFRNRYGIDKCQFWDAFDITLCDKQHKRKFVLTADARLKKKICEGVYIKITKFEHYLDEFSLHREAVVVIHDLEVVPRPSVESSELKKLPWTPSEPTKQSTNMPLASARCYYVDLWTFSLSPHQDFGVVKHCNFDTIDEKDVYLIHDVVKKKVSQYTQPILIVKVMRRYRLIHYITHSKDDKWPFQLPLMVADQSGHCSAVLWNQLGPKFYNHIKEGSILFFRNFRVKPSLQQKLKTFSTPPSGSVIYGYELSIDAHHPSGEVQIVDYTTAKDIECMGFPPLEICFMTRRDLLSVPDCTVVDVAGLITYVGRIEREARKDSGCQQKDSGAFFYRRWVHLRDTSLDAPIIVLLYCGDQEEVFMNLHPGDFLLCRHLLAKQQLEYVKSSRQKRYGWLCTTNNSWLYVFDPGDTNNLPDTLGQVVKLALPASDADYECMEQGFFRYPPFPYSLQGLSESDAKLQEKILPSNQWKAAFDRMTWRECHQFVLHASFVSLTFIKSGMSNVSSGSRHSSRKRLKLDDTQVTSSSKNKSQESADLGCSEYEHISHLWPTVLNGKKSPRHKALLIKWQGLGDSVVLNTIKPCAFHANTEVKSFTDLLVGVYDAELGLVGCDTDRTSMGRDEETQLTDSSISLRNSEFTLLVDVYTDEDNQQTVVLNRAFEKH